MLCVCERNACHVAVCNRLLAFVCVCVDMMVLISRYWRAASHYLSPPLGVSRPSIIVYVCSCDNVCRQYVGNKSVHTYICNITIPTNRVHLSLLLKITG